MRPLSARSSEHRRQPLSLTRGSWISLFAMLMIFIGPLISQSMPMDQRASSMSMNMSMDMSMDMSAMEHADHVQAALLRRALGDRTLDESAVAALREVIVDTGALAQVEKRITERASEARDALHSPAWPPGRVGR